MFSAIHGVTRLQSLVYQIRISLALIVEDQPVPKYCINSLHCFYDCLKNGFHLGCLGYPNPGPRPSYLALGPRFPKTFLTSSTSPYLKFSHYDHYVHSTFNGLWVI